MKSIIVLALLISQSAQASIPLQFSSEIKSEPLSEEAILLLNCLADESGSTWELSNTKGKHYLNLKEENESTASGVYRTENNEIAIKLKLGEAENICREIFPKTLEKPVGKSLEPELPIENSAISTQESKKSWLWLTMGVAVVAGFFYWKAQQPDHRSLSMH